MPQCKATPDAHCCWLPTGVCPYFDANKLAEIDRGCTLRLELGSWKRVHNDPRYLTEVAIHWPRKDYCGAYPVYKACATCGVEP